VKHAATSWHCTKRVVSLESPILVGILNTTPDSFSDGGKYMHVDIAIDHALEMVEAGATMIDVGGESTRPGATRVSIEEQIERAIPVVEGIARQCDTIISIDTTHSAVARAAIDAGASIINDVAAGTEDPEILQLASTTGAGIVLMHRRLPPELDRYSDQYDESSHCDDIVAEVCQWLLQRIEEARRHGISKEAIALDPGLGFGKSVHQNQELMDQVDRFVGFGYPVFIGASRKSFVGAATGIHEPTNRDGASAIACVAMAKKGAQIFRVHNVPIHTRLLQSPSHYTKQDRS